MKTTVLISIILCLFFSITYDTGISYSQSHDSGEKYTIKEGDTLWDLSKKFYGNALKWPIILDHNSNILDHRMLIPGREIVIPQLPYDKLTASPVSETTPQTVESIRDDTSSETTEQKLQLITGKTLDAGDIDSQDTQDTGSTKSNTALELLIASLNDEVSKPDGRQTLTDGKNILDALVETPVDSLNINTIPVYSLIFISQANTRSKLKYFVNDEKSYMIDGTQLVPTQMKPSTTTICDKARKVAEIIEKSGSDMGKEEYESGLVYHMKRMFLNDEERYYNFILTNVNEHFLGFATLNEPIDVLHVRIFSNYGYIYITDKGLQGLPGYFYAADARGNQIMLDTSDPILNEKYEKALDMFLSIYHKQSDIPYDPQAVEKLDRIFD